ncbi:hypothetical protein FB451DRAFT_1442777 [Mycena latifolia]|nr:hypothetical protein FB451DRAFT_1442777 [Mycena latifolia]
MYGGGKWAEVEDMGDGKRETSKRHQIRINVYIYGALVAALTRPTRRDRLTTGDISCAQLSPKTLKTLIEKRKLQSLTDRELPTARMDFCLVSCVDLLLVTVVQRGYTENRLRTVGAAAEVRYVWIELAGDGIRRDKTPHLCGLGQCDTSLGTPRPKSYPAWYCLYKGVADEIHLETQAGEREVQGGEKDKDNELVPILI